MAEKPVGTVEPQAAEITLDLSESVGGRIDGKGDGRGEGADGFDLGDGLVMLCLM